MRFVEVRVRRGSAVGDCLARNRVALCAKVSKTLGIEGDDAQIEEAEEELTQFQSMMDTSMANMTTQMATFSRALRVVDN